MPIRVGVTRSEREHRTTTLASPRSRQIGTHALVALGAQIAGSGAIDIVVKVVVMCAEEPGSHSMTMAYGLGA
jgi:hypothetical protein